MAMPSKCDSSDCCNEHDDSNGKISKKKCSHILRLNISSLLRKIDEIRFVGISESKLDSSVINSET